MIDSKKLPENRIHLFDPVGLINDTYASHGVRARRGTRSLDGFTGADAGGSPLRFAVEATGDGGDSGASSPRLWKTSAANSTSPEGSPPQPLSPGHNHYYPHPPMSPNSRRQEIVRGRRELMDMIKDMPESFYELSLRDIVEQKSSPLADHENMKMCKEKKSAVMEDSKEKHQKEKQMQKKNIKKVNKSESKNKMVRSRSIDNGGFLLKTSVFPISFGLTKKKKSLTPTGSFKVAPKPPLHAPTSTKPIKSAEKDWWRRKPCISSESESGGLSSSNSGSGRSSGSSSRSSSSSSRRGHSNRFLPGCWSFKGKK